MYSGNPGDPGDLAAAVEEMAASEVYRALGASPEGLDRQEAEERLKRFGPNSIREVKGKSLPVKLLANFTHMMAILLWIAGLVAMVAHMAQLAFSIWTVNLINGLFSFWQEYKAEKATEAMRGMLPVYASVLRDGAARRVQASGLVPGDVILLSEGDSISADGRVVEEAELRVDQSTLTGESVQVRKTSEASPRKNLARIEIPNFVFAGTSVVSGTGKAVVFATGMETEFGRIARFTQDLGDEPSPLQKEMRRVTKLVTVIAVSMGIVFFLLAVALAGVDLAESFIFAMGMIVAFVPEGLLPTVTLSLAMGVQRMAGRNALIKRLSSVETLGCTSVICTDKTGTLTQNEMTVRDIWIAGGHLTVTGTGYEPDGQVAEGGKPVAASAGSDLYRLLLAAGLCNNARLHPPNGESRRWTILGDPTEAALRVLALKAGLDLDTEERKAPRLRELPFDSRRRRMATIHRAGQSSPVVYVKGAPKEVLNLCTRVLVNGSEQPLSESLREEIMAANDARARGGLRALAVAQGSLPEGLGWEGGQGSGRNAVDLRVCGAGFPACLPRIGRLESLPHNPPNHLKSTALGSGWGRPGAGLSGLTPEAIERDLTFLGLIAMMDPPRPEVSEAVEKCHRAGIRIIMITGDYGLTAESIARRIGIIRGDPADHALVITGADIDAMDDEALPRALQQEVIVARAAPEHKLRIVKALQRMGSVVAVTGDGVNDAPALKKADIGVAMGVSGSDVAKEAADMILTDDNFASIVNAIEEGRAVYANIKKFTSYIFTSNTPEAVPFILFALSRARIPLALNVMHILAVDLGTDLVPALALGAEPPEPGLMDKPPRSLKEHVITRSLLLRAYVWLGLLQSVAVMAAFYFQYWTHGYWGQWLDLPASGPLYQSATAMALACVVTTQIGNLFAQRTELASVLGVGPFSNRLLWIGILSEIAIILMIVYVPAVQSLIGTWAFSPENWLFLFAWAPLLLIADEGRKAWLRFRKRRKLHGSMEIGGEK